MTPPQLIQNPKEETSLISLVVPIRNLHGSRIQNLLRSIELQSEKKLQVVLSNYGSTTENTKKLLETTSKFNCAVWNTPTDEVWGLPIASNIGIRRAKGKYIARLDADLILEPQVIEDTLQRLSANRSLFVIRQPIFLPEDFDCENLELPEDYEKLRAQPKRYISPSYGAFVAAEREWWHKVRGYDERMMVWGLPDWDIWRRSAHSGLKRLLIGESKSKRKRPIIKPPRDTLIYHQWHPVPHIRQGLNEETFNYYRERNREVYAEHREVVKNDEGWGLGDNGVGC
jgi:hypothetical protein